SRSMEANTTSTAGLTATPERLLRLLFAGVGLLAVGRGPGAPHPLLTLTNSLTASITLSDLLFLAGVVPVLLLSFLWQDWWLGPTICTISQAANTTTMFCTFYGMVAMALLCHVAVAWPDAALPSGLGVRLLLCGATWVLGLTASLPNWLFQRVVVEEEAQACLLLLNPAQTSCYFTLLGALAFLPCMMGLGSSFSHLGWLLWRHTHSPRGLSTILAYSNCAVSPILCFYLSCPFQARLRDLFCRPMAARHPRDVGGAGVAIERIQPGHDRAPGSLWGLAGV
ncbi:hypothetical protein EI555_013009, partial [Monodon monoceros]